MGLGRVARAKAGRAEAVETVQVAKEAQVWAAWVRVVAGLDLEEPVEGLEKAVGWGSEAVAREAVALVAKD